MQGHHSRVSFAALETADVLLAEARHVGELLLGQALFEPDPSYIAPTIRRMSMQTGLQDVAACVYHL